MRRKEDDDRITKEMNTFISQLHLRSTLPLSKDFWYCVVKIVGTFQSLKPFFATLFNPEHCVNLVSKAI